MDLPITYISKFIPNPNVHFKTLWEELDWIHHDKVPRREYYCNRWDEPYTYGKGEFARTYQPQTEVNAIINIWWVVERKLAADFDICFLNGYEDSSDQLGWHSDDSPEMDDTRPIAIVSLGAERDIMFRKKDSKEVERLKLENGSLCLMQPGMQDTHQHRIPKAGFECGPRVSLTFRGFVHEKKDQMA